MSRPTNLPDFGDPPLDEVVLGVQFDPIPGYTAVDAHGIWDLFSAEFENVEEHPPLGSQFETFGGVVPQRGMQFHFGPPPTTARLWFVSADGSHLLQFQPDRFLTNWRKFQGLVPYPRYEQIEERFGNGLQKLIDHISNSKNSPLDINQVEITYINIIPVNDFSEHDRWLNIRTPATVSVEGLNIDFTEVIHDELGKPFARLHHELQSAVSLDGNAKAFRLSLTFRGKPSDQGINGVLSFLAKGREAIVSRFAELTTPEAHEFWKRVS